MLDIPRWTDSVLLEEDLTRYFRVNLKTRGRQIELAQNTLRNKPEESAEALKGHIYTTHIQVINSVSNYVPCFDCDRMIEHDSKRGYHVVQNFVQQLANELLSLQEVKTLHEYMKVCVVMYIIRACIQKSEKWAEEQCRKIQQHLNGKINIGLEILDDTILRDVTLEEVRKSSV